jgi:hypothetical protein
MQMQQAVILDSQDDKNYVQEFHEKFKSVLMKASPEFWTLLLFDILKELCNTKMSY